MPNLKPDLALRRSLLIAAPAAASLLVLGCTGFRVRGYDLDVPFKTLAIQGQGAVAEEVRQIFLGQPKIQVLTKTIQAQAVIYILSETVDQTVIAFSSSGRPREIDLRLKVSFRVTDGFAVELLSPQEITQSRTLSVPENEVITNSVGESVLRADMQRDIANQIVRRLRALKLPAS